MRSPNTPSHVPTAAARLPAAAPGPPPILLVDDLASDAADSRAALEAAGYAVTEATDGDTALRLARTVPLRGVVSELHVRSAEGGCVVTTLKADRHRLPRPWVLACTRYREPHDVTWALDAGADAVLHKPVDPPVLQREVRRLDALPATRPPARPPRGRTP